MKLIFLLGAISVWISPDVAQAMYTSESGVGLELQYENIIRMDVNAISSNFPGTYFNSVDGNLTTQRGLLNIVFRSPSLKFRLIGGAAFGGQISMVNRSSSTTPVSETLNFDLSPAYGAALVWEVFPESKFHFRPSFRYLHTKFTGTQGSTSKGSCNYDFSSNSGIPAGCYSFSNTVSLAASRVYTIQTDFKETDFVLGLELALDMGVDEDQNPLFSFFVGGEESQTTLSGTTTLTLVTTPPTQATESVSLQNTKTSGVYAGLLIGLGPRMRFGAKYHTLDYQMWSGSFSFNF